MNYIKNSVFLIIIMVTTVLGKAGNSTTGIISEDLRLEMNTQEVILERLIKHYDKNHIIVHQNVASYYIENYGVLFEVQRFPSSEINLFSQFGSPENQGRTKYEWSEEKKAIIKVETKHSVKDSLRVLEMVDNSLQDLHLAVFEFFADYLSPVNWLKENTKVCIHFDLKLDRKIPKEYDRKMIENIVPIAVQASVGVSDLKDFQKGILSIEQFDKRIKIKKLFVDTQSYNYQILGDVLESAIKSIKSGKERPFNLYTTSITISDLGALFFLVAQYNDSHGVQIYTNFFDYFFGRKNRQEDEDKEMNKYDQLLKEVKYRLTKSIGQYGHKLENIKDDQWIVLIVNIGRNFGSFKSRFVMKIQKSYIDDYADGEITFDEFKDIVQIFEEELSN